MTRIITALTAGVLLFGCAAPAVRYADSRVTAEMLQERVKENHERVHALIGSGTMSIETSDMAQSGSFEVTLRKPDSLLLKIEGPFGIDVGSLLVTREDFYLYNSFQNRLLVGRTNPENLSRFLQFRLDFEDVLNLFGGGIFIAEDRERPSSFVIEDEEFVLTYSNPQGSRTYRIDSRNMQIVKIQQYDQRGTLLLEQLFDGFQTTDDVTVPSFIRVTMLKDRRRVSISFSDLSVNPDHVRFEFDVPHDATRARLQ